MLALAADKVAESRQHRVGFVAVRTGYLHSLLLPQSQKPDDVAADQGGADPDQGRPQPEKDGGQHQDEADQSQGAANQQIPVAAFLGLPRHRSLSPSIPRMTMHDALLLRRPRAE